MSSPHRRQTRRASRLATLGLVAALGPLPALAGSLAPAAVLAGTPRFEPWEAIQLPSEPDAVTIGDVTGDGRADIVATTGYSGNAAVDFRLVVVAQAEDGTLLPPVSYATAGTYPDRPESVALGDLDGDARTDVVVGIAGVGIQVFAQAADGTLSPPRLTPSADSLRVRAANLDKDQRLDVAGIGWGTDTVTVFSDTGAGLVARVTYPARHDGYDDLELGDVTGDGLADLVVMSGQGLVPNVSVLAQLANGTFGPAVEHSVGDRILTHGIGIGDVTGDARADVVASFGGNRPSSGIAVFAQADGTLAAPQTSSTYDIPEPVEVADVDLDGRPDVIVAHGGWNRIGVHAGQLDGSLAPETLFPVPYASHYNPHGLAVGDITGDGYVDLVLADYNNGLVILRNSGPFTETPPPATVPGAPDLTSAVPGDGSVTLAWAAPASDGGSGISGYTATARPGGATCIVATLGCAIDGLENGTTYTFTVSATNAIGTGPASNGLSATPVAPSRTPSAPLELAAAPNLAAGVGLTWTAPADPGTSPVASYRVFRGSSTTALAFLASVGDVRAFTDTTAANGFSWWYAISAVSAAGEGPRTAPVLAQRGTAPGAPTSLTTTAAKPGIVLAWSPPTSNGGAAVTDYRIYRGTTSGSQMAIATVPATTTSFTDALAARRTKYWYRVTAVNVLGEGPSSGVVSATAR